MWLSKWLYNAYQWSLNLTLVARRCKYGSWTPDPLFQQNLCNFKHVHITSTLECNKSRAKSSERFKISPGRHIEVKHMLRELVTWILAPCWVGWGQDSSGCRRTCPGSHQRWTLPEWWVCVCGVCVWWWCVCVCMGVCVVHVYVARIMSRYVCYSAPRHLTWPQMSYYRKCV